MESSESPVLGQAANAATIEQQVAVPVLKPQQLKRWDDDLSPEQRAACAVPLRHSCLLAGPGTGKTRILTHRVAYLHQVHSVPLDRIVVLTFTRATARELRERLRRDFGDEYSLVRVSTIHAFALRQLMRNDSHPAAPDRVVIADDLDEDEVIFPDLKRRLQLRNVTEVETAINQVAAGWAQTTADDPNWERTHHLARLLGALREHRAVYGYALRSELVYQLYRALSTKPSFDLEPFDHVLVDEYQDLTECELRVVLQLTNRGAVLYAAGDDDQAIYGWREATPEGIRRFEGDFGADSFVRLRECQRCDRGIVNLAGRVISLDPDRIPKNLHSISTGVGEIRCVGYPGDVTEARGVAGICRAWIDAGVEAKDLLILARGKKEIPRIADALQEIGLAVAEETDPYGELNSPEGRKVLLFLRLVLDEDEHLAWRELVRRSGFGESTVIAYHDAALTSGKRFGSLLGAVQRDPSEHPALPRRSDVAAFVGATLQKLQQFKDSVALDSSPGNLNAQLELLVDLALGESSPPLVALLTKAAKEVAAESGEGVTWKDAASALAGRRAGVNDDGEASPGIRVMTMHNAKGLDGVGVVLVGADHEVMHSRATTPAQWLEEVRLLYVSLTRARRRLAITFPGRRTGGQRYRIGGTGQHRLSDALRDFLQPELVR